MLSLFCSDFYSSVILYYKREGEREREGDRKMLGADLVNIEKYNMWGDHFLSSIQICAYEII